jgi:hypothetical protein
MFNKDLIEITTPRQAKNGTRAWKCSRTGALYGSYASGSVRRTPLDFQFGYKTPTRLNKRNVTVLHKDKFNGKTFLTTTSKFIMIPHEEDRIALINHRSASYKGYIYNIE